MKDLVIFGIEIHPAIYVSVFYFLWVTVLLALKKLVFVRVRKFADKTATKFDDIFLNALDLPLVLFIFVSGIFVLENVFEFGLDGDLLKWVAVAFKATTILAIIIFFDRLLRGLIENYSHKMDHLKR